METIEKFCKNRISFNMKKRYINDVVDFGASSVFDEF